MVALTVRCCLRVVIDGGLVVGCGVGADSTLPGKGNVGDCGAVMLSLCLFWFARRSGDEAVKRSYWCA